MVREFCTRLIKIWVKLGHFIGDLVARFALLIVFWFTVVPTRMLWLVLKKDPMQRKWSEEKKSYFQEPEPTDPDHWRRMF